MASFLDSPYFLFALLLVSAFTMPLIFMVWIRNTARHDREPWKFVVRAFLWGAVFSVIIAIIFSLVLAATLGQVRPLTEWLARRIDDPAMIPLVIGAVIVAPLVEEAAKGLGVRAGRPEIQRLLDGLVYGAAAGLGFSATENLFYGINALLDPNGGATASFIVIAIRSFSSSFLHASSTAVVGYGLAKSWLMHRPWAVLPFYLIAVTMHASFNLISVLGELYSARFGVAAEAFTFGAAVVFALVAITVVRMKLASPSRAVSP
ncbi:MAG TPA: PrsW family intramembrane metalloprotease [Thermoplasmata archaeon]|nr:PrsW family intramembrane metalloprotease [Thermoplasmata archaeon]